MLFPSELRYPAEPVVGAETLHHVMCGWLADLGQDAYRPEHRPPAHSG